MAEPIEVDQLLDQMLKGRSPRPVAPRQEIAADRRRHMGFPR